MSGIAGKSVPILPPFRGALIPTKPMLKLALLPSPKPVSHHKVAAGPFAIALIATPLLVALLGFWVVLIPVAAVLFGGIPWLIIGGPVLWMGIARSGPNVDFVGRSVVAHLLGTPIFVLTYEIAVLGHIEWDSLLAIMAFMLMFGLLFSMIWGAVFGWLYKRFAKIEPRPKDPDIRDILENSVEKEV